MSSVSGRVNYVKKFIKIIDPNDRQIQMTMDEFHIRRRAVEQGLRFRLIKHLMLIAYDEDSHCPDYELRIDLDSFYQAAVRILTLEIVTSKLKYPSNFCENFIFGKEKKGHCISQTDIEFLTKKLEFFCKIHNFTPDDLCYLYPNLYLEYDLKLETSKRFTKEVNKRIRNKAASRIQKCWYDYWYQPSILIDGTLVNRLCLSDMKNYK